jgi:hypothetical protein
MPGFANVLSRNQRWDVVNFIRARAVGALAARDGPEVGSAAAPEVPDFAFEAGRVQQTLRQTVETGPVLLVLFKPPAPLPRLRELAAAGLRVIAVGVASPEGAGSEEGSTLVVGAYPEVIAALALFRADDDGGETELLLDRGCGIRARWTRNMPGGLAALDGLAAQAERIARIAVAAPGHAGHTH